MKLESGYPVFLFIFTLSMLSISCAPLETNFEWPSNLTFCDEALPCWEEIVIGKTSVKSADNLLKRSPLVVPSSIEYHRDMVDERYGFTLKDHLGSGRLVGVDGVIVWMNLDFEQSIALSKLELNESPAYIRNAKYGNFPCYVSTIVIPEQGVGYSGGTCDESKLSYIESEGLMLLVEANMKIDEVYLFNPSESLETYVAENIGDIDAVGWHQEWNGYGEYQILAPR